MLTVDLNPLPHAAGCAKTRTNNIIHVDAQIYQMPA